MWMADGNAYRCVCAPVEKLGEHSCKPFAEDAGPGPAFQKRPYFTVQFPNTRAPSFSCSCLPLSGTKSDETGPGGSANSWRSSAIPTPSLGLRFTHLAFPLQGLVMAAQCTHCDFGLGIK